MARSGSKPRQAPDLTKAVAAVHRPSRRSRPEEQAPPITTELLLAAGDARSRRSYFDHDDSQRPLRKGGKPVRLVLAPGATLHDYRTPEGRRTHRAMITVPPKLRALIAELSGRRVGDDFPMTTALIALADYAAAALIREQKMLVVSAAEDPDADRRQAVRRHLRRIAPRWE